jgi:hypothetical protein
MSSPWRALASATAVIARSHREQNNEKKLVYEKSDPATIQDQSVKNNIDTVESRQAGLHSR